MKADKQTLQNKQNKKVKKYILKSLKIGSKAILLSGVVSALGCGFYLAKTVHDSPKITGNMIKEAVGGTSNMYASDGTIIWSDTDHIRDFIKFEDIPKNYINILLSTEDSDFYQNYGFSPKGIFNAIKTKGARGGSGINQQLVKNLVFSSDVKHRTIERKIQELFLSMQMENNFSKNKILETYINMINMGEGSYGANTIAVTYYNKSLKDLTGNDPMTISKLAIIAGLGQAPSAYNLYDNPQLVEKRRNEVLLSAYNKGKISKDLYKKAKAVPVQDGLQPRHWRNTNVITQGNEHSAYISSALNQVKELGYDLDKTPMQIYTALNPKVDSDVKYIFDSYEGYQDDGMQASGTFIDPKTGFVMAQYGGRGSQAFGLNRATQNTRSSGSSTKPWIAYGPAIQYYGKGSGTILDSSNYTYPGTNITASNYGGYTYGNVTMTKALKLSLNTPAIRLLDNVTGSDNTKKFLQGVDLDVKDTYGGQDALGINISTQQLAAAQATLANLGTYKKPQYITKLVFDDNSEKNITFQTNKAMNESTAYILLRMCEEVPKVGGTAEEASLPFQGYAVKTGTVGFDSSYGFPDNTASDLWIGGTTKSVSAAVWLGYDTPYQQGGQIREAYYHTHHELFRRLMEYFNAGKDTSQWAQPATVRGSSTESLYPTDFGIKVSQYSVPEVTGFNNSIFSTLNAKSTKKLKDKGFSTYKTPKDFDPIMNWQSSVDQNMLNTYNLFGGDALKAVVNNENAYISQNLLNGNIENR